MNLKAVDWISILTVVAGLAGTGALGAFGSSIDAWAPGWGTKTVAVLSSVSLGAGILLRIFTNKTGAPATAVVADAKVVAPDTTVVHPQTPVEATVVSTTSKLLPQNGDTKGP